MHQWQEKDDLIAFLLYRGKFSENLIVATASFIGCSPESLMARIRNFTYLETGDGASHYAAQTKDIFDRLKNL